MAKAMATKGTVTVVELVLAQSYELAALVNLLERKGVLTQGEVLEEIRRLRASRGPGRFFRVKGNPSRPHSRVALRVNARGPGESRSGVCFSVPS